MRFVYGGTILVMLAMAIFGAFGAAHGMEHGGGCFVATAAGMPCMADLAESLDMHFNTLRSFSLAVFAISFTLALLLVVRRALCAFVPPNGARFFAAPFRLLAISHKPFANLRWITRLEHSPSFLFG